MLVYKHDTAISHKLVDHYLLKETIKNYLHDFEIQIKSQTKSEIARFKEIIDDKMTKIDDIEEKTMAVRYVTEKDHVKEIAKIKDKIEGMNELHK